MTTISPSVHSLSSLANTSFHMQHHSNRKEFRRVRTWFWIFEILEFLLSIAIVGVTGSAAQGLKDDLHFPSPPGKLSYNIAVAVITMLLLLALIPLDLLRPRFWGDLNTAWAPWPRVVLNATFTVLWAAGIGSSVYTCNDMCSTAPSEATFLIFASLCCNCVTSRYAECSIPVGDYILGVEERSYVYEATQGLDAVVMALFLVSTFMLAALYWVHEPAAQTAPAIELHGAADGKHQGPEPEPPKYSNKDVTNW